MLLFNTFFLRISKGLVRFLLQTSSSGDIHISLFLTKCHFSHFQHIFSTKDLQDALRYALNIKRFLLFNTCFLRLQRGLIKFLLWISSLGGKDQSKIAFFAFFWHFQPILSTKYFQDAMGYALTIKQFFVL